ncbi:MAG: hypothetical protein ACR2QO_21785 [Acidimicrobiales bacterium]
MIRKIKNLVVLLLLALAGLSLAGTPVASATVDYVLEEGPRVRDYASCNVERLLDTMAETECQI